MAAPRPNRNPPSNVIRVNCQPPIWPAAAGISHKKGSVRAITQSADLPMLASMKAVRALMTSATARTVQMLPRCAAKPKRPANRQATTSGSACTSMARLQRELDISTVLV